MTRSPNDANKITPLHPVLSRGKASPDPDMTQAPDTAGQAKAAPDGPAPDPSTPDPGTKAPTPAALPSDALRGDGLVAAAVMQRVAAPPPAGLNRGQVSPARPPGQPERGQPESRATAPASPAVLRAGSPETAMATPPRPVLRPGPGPAAVALGPATRPVAGPAELQSRHRGILISFLALVALPVIAAASYLWIIAEDQYASTVGFSVRTEEVSSSLDLLGGITRLTGGGSSDADILYDYIHSQELVEHLDGQIDLRAVFSTAWPRDPVFAFDPTGSIEDLVKHWERKVRITYDSGSGLMTLRVLAFSPGMATEVATRILQRSTEKVNELSQDAREDATRYARDEMERALERLKVAREDMTRFRMRTRVVDPLADLQGQMGILNSLQSQLAETYVELDLLLAGSTNAGDPRITQLEQRIRVIQNRMVEERQKFGEDGQGPGGEDFATIVAEFERLTVDREFAEQAYRVALAAYDGALAEAQRKSRYLAAHIQPTKAERAEYPARWTLLGLTGFFLLMAWSIGVLIYYSIRDRR